MASGRLLIDVRPLRASRQFRLLWLGMMVSAAGSQFTVVAAPLQVYLLTQSGATVGLLSLAQIVPLVLGSFVGGALADAYDRRTLLLVAQVLLALISVGLAVNAMQAAPSLAVIFVLAPLQAALAALDHTTRSSVTPMLVPRDLLPSALVLNQIMWQVAQVVGPGLAGLVIAVFGVGAAYWVDVASFGSVIVALLLMKPLRPAGGGTRVSRSGMLDGVRFLKGRQALQGTFVIDINAMLFGMPVALFPALGIERFGGIESVGLLYAAAPAGAFVGAFTSGWLSAIDRQGRGVVIAVVLWGAAIALFGLSPWLALALLLLAVAGAADVISAVFRNSILQLSVPDKLRGRLNAVHIAVVTGGPRLGDVEAGVVASLTSPAFSVVSGGLACLVGALAIGRAMPALPRWRLSRDALPEEEVRPDAA